MWSDPTGPGLGVPGLSVLIDRRFLRSENEPDLDRDLMELIGMERLVGLRNMPGEAMVVGKSRAQNGSNQLQIYSFVVYSRD